MTYSIDIQNACITPLPFSRTLLRSFAVAALKTKYKSAEVTLRFVENEEMIQLNKTYRHLDKTTNVLAFPADMPDIVQWSRTFLGDVIICPSVLATECISLSKPFKDYTAHIIIHGVLHLLGYDHIIEEDAVIMQDLEAKILNKLNLHAPYPKPIDEENL